MLSQKMFDLLVFLTEQTEACSQRNIATAMDLSIGTVNKLMKEATAEGYMENGKISIRGYEVLEPYRVRRVILMAAGFGSRMVPITLNTPKPLVRVKGVRLIDTLLDAILAAKIPEIYIVRGYLGEQFDQLLYKYPMVKFIENPQYNEANNIASVMQAGELIQNAYIMEADLLLRNPKLIQTYQYRSNYLGIPMERSDDYCMFVEKGRIKGISLGGTNCYQIVGISYWTQEDGEKLVGHIQEVFAEPGGKERLWGTVPLVYRADEYSVGVRECRMEDVIEIDSYKELVALDPGYAV